MQPSVEQVIAQQSHRDKWRVLATVMIGTIAAILSSTIVNVAVPDLSHHFTLGQERAQWVSTGFMLAMTLSMLTTPWLLKRFGLRRTYAGAADEHEIVRLSPVRHGRAGGFRLWRRPARRLQSDLPLRHRFVQYRNDRGMANARHSGLIEQ